MTTATAVDMTAKGGAAPGTDPSTMDDTVVDVRDLVKVYKGDVRAVDDVTFSVERGGFFGFLGPNGAGKTTTIRILSTLLHPTSGSARLLGLDVVHDAAEVRRRIGFGYGTVMTLSEHASIPDDHGSDGNLSLYLGLSGQVEGVRHPLVVRRRGGGGAGRWSRRRCGHRRRIGQCWVRLIAPASSIRR